MKGNKAANKVKNYMIKEVLLDKKDNVEVFRYINGNCIIPETGKRCKPWVPMAR